MIRATVRLRLIYGGIGKRAAVDAYIANTPRIVRDRLGLSVDYRDVEAWTEETDHEAKGAAFMTRHNIVVTLLATSPGAAEAALQAAYREAWKTMEESREIMGAFGNVGTVLVTESSREIVDVGNVEPSEFDGVGGAS